MIEVEIEDKYKLQLEPTNKGILINGLLSAFEIVKLSNTSFKAIGETTIYSIDLIKLDGKQMILSINNKVVSLSISDHIDQILEKLGMDTLQNNSVAEIKAPMPGSILDIMVKEGDEVKTNDQLLVLEAMKMENVIKSPGEGTVYSVHVSPKENVEKNQVLISFK